MNGSNFVTTLPIADVPIISLRNHDVFKMKCCNCVYSGYSLNETISPQNQAVAQDAEVLLHCKRTGKKSGSWRFRHSLSKKAVLIYWNNNFTEEYYDDVYKIDDDVKGHFDLTFPASNVTAGQYLCRKDNTTTSAFYIAYVTVLG